MGLAHSQAAGSGPAGPARRQPADTPRAAPAHKQAAGSGPGRRPRAAPAHRQAADTPRAAPAHRQPADTPRADTAPADTPRAGPARSHTPDTAPADTPQMGLAHSQAAGSGPAGPARGQPADTGPAGTPRAEPARRQVPRRLPTRLDSPAPFRAGPAAPRDGAALTGGTGAAGRTDTASPPPVPGRVATSWTCACSGSGGRQCLPPSRRRPRLRRRRSDRSSGATRLRRGGTCRWWPRSPEDRRGQVRRRTLA